MRKIEKYLPSYFDISDYDVYLIYVFKRTAKRHDFGHYFKTIVGTGENVWLRDFDEGERIV